jgi:hypothetical protein
MQQRPSRTTSGTRAVDAPLLVGTLASTRRPRIGSKNEIIVDERPISRVGGWISLRTESTRVHAAMRAIEVHLRLVFHDDAVSAHPAADVFIDRVRVSDIEWRSVSAFLADGAEAWASVLLEETRRLLGLPTQPTQRRA